MYILMHIAMPIGKGTYAQCEAMMSELILRGNDAKHFLILSADEYETI
jgi:hypothetical protein